MRGSRLGAVLLASAIGLVALTPGAAAGSGDTDGSPPPRPLVADAEHQAEPPSRAFVQPTVSLGKHDGYNLELYGSGDRVYLSVDRGQGISVYVAPGIATSKRLEASFGDLGRVALRFRVARNKTWVKPRRKCQDKQFFVNRRGVFTGTVAFRGEGGYVSARTHRAKGYVTAIAAKCLRKIRELERGLLSATAGASGLGRPPVFAGAGWRGWNAGGARSRPSSAFLMARRQEADSIAYVDAETRKRGTSFFAEASESRGGVAIVRYAFADGGFGRFRVDSTLASATVKPPAPFHGSATYSAAPDGSRTWRGSLSVNFPGAPRTPLAGPGFGVRLSAGS